MASSSGASFESEDQEVERKRRRMQSNRESARRSRLRKQKLLDDLTEQVSRLRKNNNEMVANMNVAANLCVSLEAENSILRAQIGELTHRLQSLNDIVIFISSTAIFETSSSEVSDLMNNIGFEDEDYYYCNPWGSPFAN